MTKEQLIFGNKESIRKADELEKKYQDRERRIKESGLSRERYEVKEELKYWGVDVD